MNPELNNMESRHEKYHDLIGRHGSLVHSFCWRCSSGSRHLFQELMQECHISIFQHIHTLRHDADGIQEGAWVIWQCRNVFSHRKRRKHPEWIPIDSHLSDTHTVPQEEGHLELLWELAVHLNERQQYTLSLILQGYTIKEIAETLDIKPDSVKKQRQRIIEKMRQAYNDNFMQNGCSGENKNMNGKSNPQKT